MKTAALSTNKTIIHCKTALVNCTRCGLTSTDSLADCEGTGIDSLVEILEGTMRELPGVFKSPKCVSRFNGVVGLWGINNGSGFSSYDNFTTDLEILWVKSGVELL